MIRSPAFFRAYRAVPHVLVNRCAAAVARQTKPAFLVRAAVRAWIAKDRIDMNDFRDEDYASLERFFLRRLDDRARPLGEGIVSPVDGIIVAEGSIDRDTILQVKGSPYRVSHLVNGRDTGSATGQIDVAPFDGGRFLTIFLSPRGYHYVHAPESGRVKGVHWIRGRFFPQNEDALHHIPRIYERNERAVLRISLGPRDAILVMVGASVIGGIHVVGAPDLRRREPTVLDREVAKGDELGHFTFGSTVVLLLPPGARAPRPRTGDTVRMGETLWNDAS